MDKKPFGEYVEGLSYCGDKSCVNERKVQTHDFEDSTFFVAVSGKPFLPQNLRKFKHFGRQLAHFVAGTVHGVQLQLDGREAIPNLGALPGVGRLIHVVGKPHVEKPILLFSEQRLLPLKLVPHGLSLGLPVLGLGTKDRPEPVPDFFILDPHLVEQGQNLPVEIGFGNPGPGMARLRVPGAAVVDVILRPGLGELCLDLAGDGMAAVGTCNQLAAVGRQMRCVVLVAEQRLHPVPCRPVDQRFLLAGIPVPFVLDLADIGPVPKDVVDGASRELRSCLSPDAAFRLHLLGHAIQSQVPVGVKKKDPPDVFGRDGIDFHDAASILPDVLVAVGSQTHEPAFADAAGQAFPNID